MRILGLTMLNHLFFSGYLILSLGISEQRIQKGCFESVTSLYLLGPLVQTALRTQMWAGYTCGSRPLKETSTPVGKC